MLFLVSPKKFSSGCGRNRKKLGLMTSTGLPVEAVVEGTLGRRLLVWPMYSLYVEQFFQLILPFAIIYYDSHHLEDYLKCAFPNKTQPLLSFNVTSGLRQKFSGSVSWGYLLKKNCLFGKTFVSGYVVLYLRHWCQLLDPRCFGTAFAGQRMVFADVWDDQLLFLS